MTIWVAWPWVLAAGVAVVALFVPLVAWRKHRIGYAAALSVMGILVVSMLWVRGLSASERAGIQYTSSTEAADETWEVLLVTGDGGLDIHFRRYDIVRNPEYPEQRGPINPDGKFCLGWDKSPKKYPGWSYPKLIDGGGFQLVVASEFKTFSRMRHLWAFVFPAWFPIPFLLILPALYARQVWRRRRVARWIAAGCCAKCGYDLRAHKTGEKCPECGAVIADSPKKEATTTGTSPE